MSPSYISQQTAMKTCRVGYCEIGFKAYLIRVDNSKQLFSYYLNYLKIKLHQFFAFWRKCKCIYHRKTIGVVAWFPINLKLDLKGTRLSKLSFNDRRSEISSFRWIFARRWPYRYTSLYTIFQISVLNLQIRIAAITLIIISVLLFWNGRRTLLYLLVKPQSHRAYDQVTT
jgi:hypothetical protein